MLIYKNILSLTNTLKTKYKLFSKLKTTDLFQILICIIFKNILIIVFNCIQVFTF